MNKTLAIVLVFLAASYVANVVLIVTYFNSQNVLTSERIQKNEAFTTIEELTGINQGLMNGIDALETERDSLKYQISSLVSERDEALANLNTLSAEVGTLRSGKLMTNLGSFDNRDNELLPYLHVYGVVWNVGTESVVNCRIHVVGKQDLIVAVDTYIYLPPIDGYDPYPYTSFKEIDEKVYYYGIALTENTVTIEYY